MTRSLRFLYVLGLLLLVSAPLAAYPRGISFIAYSSLYRGGNSIFGYVESAVYPTQYGYCWYNNGPGCLYYYDHASVQYALLEDGSFLQGDYYEAPLDMSAQRSFSRALDVGSHYYDLVTEHKAFVFYWDWDYGFPTDDWFWEYTVATQQEDYWPPPSIASINPSGALLGDNGTMEIYGQNFSYGTLTINELGPGITMGINYYSDTYINAWFSISPSATPGPYGLTVKAGGGTSNAVTFNIVSPGP